jgi:hypothetical protein
VNSLISTFLAFYFIFIHAHRRESRLPKSGSGSASEIPDPSEATGHEADTAHNIQLGDFYLRMPLYFFNLNEHVQIQII